MRVVFLLDWFVYYTAPIANALSARAEVSVIQRTHGYEIGISGQSEAGRYRRQLFMPEVTVGFVRGSQSNPLTLYDALKAVWTLRRHLPDVVHIQDNSDWRLALIASCLRRPWVVTVHDVVPHLGATTHPNFIQRVVRRRLLRGARAIVVHAQYLADLLRYQPYFNPQTQVAVIPHGPLAHGCRSTDTPPLPGRFTLLFFGRLEGYKGLDVLIEAFRAARARRPDIELIIAGDGTMRQSVERLVRETEGIEFRPGFVPDEALSALFGECSVLVAPYKEASQSGVIPLAYSFGRCVIASRVGGIGEAVQDGVTGVLVPPDDAVSLSEAIVALAGDAAKVERMGRASREAVETGWLSVQAIAELHERLYRSILEKELH